MSTATLSEQDTADLTAAADALGITPTTSARGRGKGKAAPPAVEGTAVQLLPLALLDDDPRNRAGDDLGDLTEMADSIREVGLLEPILVTPGSDGRYTIVAGHRRRRALELAGLAAALCTVRADLTPEQAIAARAIENLHREDLTPLQEAACFKELADLGHSQRAIAKLVGKSQPHISKRLDLLGLPEAVTAAFLGGEVTIEEARELGKLDEADVVAVLGANTYVSVSRRIEARKAEVEFKTLRAAEEQAIRDEGLRLYEGRPAGGQMVDQYPLADRVTKAAHAKLDCYAWWVPDYGSVRRVAVCLKPTSHKPKERKETAAEKRTRLEHERLRAEEEAAKHAQAAAWAKALAGKPTKAWDEFLAEVFLSQALEDVDDRFTSALDLRCEDDDNPHDLVDAFAAKGPAQRQKVLLVHALEVASQRWASERARTAFEAFLTSYGWQKPEAS